MDEILRQTQDDIKNKRLIDTEEAAISISECGLRIAELKSQKRLVPTEEAAKVLGVTSRAIQKWFANGKLEGQFESGKRAGKSGMKLYVYINPVRNSSAEEGGIISNGVNDTQNGDSPDSTILAEALIRKSGTVPKSRTRVGRGEPGCHVVTPIVNGEPTCLPPSPSPRKRPEVLRGPPSPARGEEIGFEALPSSPLLEHLLRETEEPTPDGGAIISTSNLPAILDSCFRRNDKAERIANLRFALIQAFNEEAAKNHRPRKEIIQNFLNIYTGGIEIWL